MLAELVKFLAMEYRVLKQLLDPSVSLYACNKNRIEKDYKIDSSMNVIDKPSLKKY